MLKNREKRAFWLLLLWIFALPLMQDSHLAAQDDDLILGDAEPVAEQNASGDQPLPDEGPVLGGDQTATETPEASAETPEASAEGEDPAAMPALSADPTELIGKVNGLAKAGKHKEVIAELQDFEDAVAESAELLTIYVEALIKIDKPDYNLANRMAKTLAEKDPGSSLADYVQGLYWQNAKKPDLAKAIASFSKAKSAKKPYADAAMAYYMAMVKKFWMILLAVVALPVVVIIKKKQKAVKIVEINLDGSDLPPADQTVVQLEGGSEKAPVSVAEPGIVAGAEVAGEETSVVADATDTTVSAAPKKIVKIVKKIKTVVKPKEPESPSLQHSPATSPITPAGDTPAQAAFDRTPAPMPVSAPASVAPYRPAQNYETITAKHQAEIEQIRDLSRPERRPSIQADPELDALWGNLSRKALQGRIAPQYRTDDLPASSGANWRANTGSRQTYADLPEPGAFSDVTIDLSEEALKDDLSGKLKMLAISDAELRELFAQKNPGHIPHLIEYVLTRPEPVRLAFVAREIGYYGDPAVLDTLASLLYHEDVRVAMAAIQGLENSKKPAAILHICPFLRSDVPLLAQTARTALANFGAPKILQAFRDLAEHPDVKIREAGIFVLSRMKGSAVEDLLKKMLNDDSLEIRSKTILAMSYQKNPVYIDPLRDFFRIATDTDKTLARKAIVYLQGFVNRK